MSCGNFRIVKILEVHVDLEVKHDDNGSDDEDENIEEREVDIFNKRYKLWGG